MLQKQPQTKKKTTIDTSSEQSPSHCSVPEPVPENYECTSDECFVVQGYEQPDSEIVALEPKAKLQKSESVSIRWQKISGFTTLYIHK